MVTKWKSQPYDVKKAHIELVSRMNTPAKYIVDDSPRKSPQFSSQTIPKAPESPVAAEQIEPQTPIIVKPKLSSMIADLFLSPSDQPIVHSSRGVVYRSITSIVYKQRIRESSLVLVYKRNHSWICRYGIGL